MFHLRDEPAQPWITRSSRPVHTTPWFTVREDQVGTQAGAELTYTYLERPGVVLVVPVLADGRIALIRNYRYVIRVWCWEVPAGGREDQTVEEAAARELREEIGGTAESFRPLSGFYLSNGTSNEYATVVLARGVTLAEPEREPGELLYTVPMPVADALSLARTGQIADGPSALALLLCEPYLSEDRPSRSSGFGKY
jgi:ADP-ribose pyrophosphatase